MTDQMSDDDESDTSCIEEVDDDDMALNSAKAIGGDAEGIVEGQEKSMDLQVGDADNFNDDDEEEELELDDGYVMLQQAHLDLTELPSISATTDLYLIYKTPREPLSRVNLHFRQGVVRAVFVNGTQVSYRYLDAMSTLKATAFKFENVDMDYRLALEISHGGELEIELPQDIGRLDVSSINTHEDDASRDKLGMMSDFLFKMSEGLLALKISVHYSLDSPTLGLVVRKSSDGAVLGIHSLYGGGLSTSLLHNVDGVRCWLPCVDRIDQRTVFDISIKTPQAYAVICSGRKISELTLMNTSEFADTAKSPYSVESVEDKYYTIRRFLSLTGIPVYSLGIFVGKVVVFELPLSEQLSDTDCVKVVVADVSTYTEELEMKVKWSTLGLGNSLVELHRIVGVDSVGSNYCFIFVQDLGFEKFSFSGFSIIDMNFLYRKDQLYMEHPSHLSLLRAYLYSWFQDAILLRHFNTEVIVHGAVGYCIFRYLEAIFGEHYSRFLYLKMHDQILFVEASGRAHPLTSNLVYEEYEHFCPVYLKYMKCKSVVVFQMMENILGSESMKFFIQKLLGIQKQSEFDFNGDETATMRSTSLHSFTGNASLVESSEEFNLAFQLAPKCGKEVDYSALSAPTVFCILRARGYHLSDIGNILRGLQSDLAVNSISTNTFFDRWLSNTGVLYLRVAVDVDPQSRCTTLILDQVSSKGSCKSLTPSYYEDKVCVFVLESDKTNTEPMLKISKGLVPHNVPFRAPIIKRGPGGNRKKQKTTIDIDDPTQRQLLEREQEEERRRENANALAMARKLDPIVPPVRFISIDPYNHWIKKVHLVVPDTMMAEQLFCDIDANDVCGQVNALRNLSIARLGSYRKKSIDIRIKAFSDCILKVKIPPIEIEHSKFVRAEAAFCLANWQNEHAPKTSEYEEDVFVTTWPGLNQLIKCIHMLFSEDVFEDTTSDTSVARKSKRKPKETDLVNEDFDYLRNALMVALSTIKAKDGTTPFPVIETLLFFIEGHMRSYAEAFTVNSKDDTYYNAIALYALSNVTLGDHIRNCHKWKKRILDIARDTLELRRAQRAVESSVDVSIEDIDDPSEKNSSNGLLFGAAMHCIFCIETQNPQEGDESVINYWRFLNDFYDPIIQKVALDCCLRLEVLSLIDEQNEDSIVNLFSTVITVIKSKTSSSYIRRTAAQIFFDVIQDRPSEVIPDALSLSELTQSYCDCVVTKPHRRYQEQIRNSLSSFSSVSFADILLQIHELITASYIEQSVRFIFLSIWKYLFKCDVPLAVQQHRADVLERCNSYNCSEKQLAIYGKAEMLPVHRLIDGTDDICLSLLRLEEIIRFNGLIGNPEVDEKGGRTLF